MAKKTQKAIVDAFVALLADRPMEKITVMDVCEASGVSRSTFYYHYHDMYELLSALFRSDVDTFLASDFTVDNWAKGLADAAEFAMANKRVFLHIYSGLRHEILEEYLFSVGMSVAGNLVRSEAEKLGNVPEADIATVTSALASMFVGLSFKWLRQGLNRDALQALPKIQRMLDGYAQSSLKKLAA